MRADTMARRRTWLILLPAAIACFNFFFISVSDIKEQPDGGQYRVVRTNNGPVEEDNRVKVYAPSNSTSNVAICLVVKNETLYLDEWIDFHIALGFSPIYIYDNSLHFELNFTLHYGGDTWYETRGDIRDHIELIHMPDDGVQYPAYDRCLKKDAVNSTFIALTDVDEFLVLKNFSNVIDFMDHHCGLECGQLSINWQMMGTSGQKEYTPEPITKRNVHWSGEKFGTIKVIVRPSYVADSHGWRHSVILKKGHWIDTAGNIIVRGPRDWKRQANEHVPYDVAVLYHYAFKSDGEIHYTNCVRGVHSPHRGQLHCAIVKVITKWRLVRCLMIRHGGNIDIDAHGTKIGCTTMQQTPHCQSKIDTHKRRFSGSKNQKEEHVVHFSNALDLQTLGRCTHWSVLRYIHYLKLGIFWVTK